MTLHDDATGTSIILMVVIGVPCLLLIIPSIIQGFAGDWSKAYSLIKVGWHWVEVIIASLIILILIVGAILE